MTTYMVRTRRGEIGPLDGAEVRLLATTGQLEPDDLICPSNGSQWRAARSVKGFVAPTALSEASGRSGHSAATAKRTWRWLPIVAIAASCSLITGLGVWAVTYLTSAAAATRVVPSGSTRATTEANSIKSPQRESGHSSNSRDLHADVMSADELAESADQAVVRGDTELAIVRYRKALSAEPGRVDIRIELAEALSEADLLGEAIVEYKYVLEHYPDDTRVLIGFANAAIRTKKIEMIGEAIVALERARSIEPENHSVLTMLLVIYEQANMPARFVPVAEAFVNGFLGDPPDSGHPSSLQLATMSVLASMYFEDGRVSDAEQVFRTALEYDSGFDDARFGLVEVLLSREAIEEALGVLDGIEQPSADSWYWYMRVAVDKKDFESAAEAMRSSLELDATQAFRWHLLAIIEFSRKRVAEALEASARATAIDDGDPKYRALHIELLLESGRHQEALRDVERLAANGGSPGVILGLRGLALVGLGRIEDAEFALREAMEVGPSVKSGLALTNLLNNRDAWLESAAVYKQLEELQSDGSGRWRRLRAMMHVRMAISLHERGDLEGAIEQRRMSVSVDPSDDNKSGLARVLKRKAVELMLMNDFAGARRYNVELSRFDAQEAAELGRLIVEAEHLAGPISVPSDSPTTRAVEQTSGVVDSVITSDFTGKVFSHGNLFELRNGQIWRQTEYYIFYHYAYTPQVRIVRSGGVWRMKVDGISHAVAVERVR